MIAVLCLLASCVKNTHENKTKVSKNIIYDKAIIFYEKGKQDSAYLYFERAKPVFAAKRETLGVVRCLQYMAIISTDVGDHYSSQELASETLNLLEAKNKDHFPYLQSSYSTLGMAADNLKEYKQALTFYQMALRYAKGNEYELIIENNVANAYRNLKEYNKAIDIYKKIITRNKKEDSFYAQVLTNLSIAKWLRDSSYDSSFDLIKALKIREKENDLWGQHSSNSHLSEYYAKKRPDSALYYAKSTYNLSKRIESPDNQLEALKKLIQMSSIIDSKNYFSRYQLLLDSISTSRNSSKNQFALIRYETEKNKADFLKAQEENIKKQNSIVIGYIGIGILITFSIASYFWYRRRQKILKQEKEIEIKNTEIKYVKKVHDHVANRIYQVMDEIDNRPQMDKDEVAEKLDVIYHISRDLSYENIDTTYKPGFSKVLSKMFSSYQSARLNIVVNGNKEQIWEAVQETVKAEVFTILQELMTNMRKHSGADLVHVEFQQDQQRITILYSDNGKGIQHFSPGNGLKNTETRIKSISGIITFGNEATQGLHVKLSFPI